MLPTALIQAAVGGTSAVVTLSGESINGLDGTTSYAGVRINTDGTVDENVDAAYSQIDTATDWVIPNSFSSKKTYHVRATEDSWNSNGTRNGTMGSWLQLSSNREWYIENSIVGNADWTITIAISDDGGSTTIDTGQYILSANVI